MKLANLLLLAFLLSWSSCLHAEAIGVPVSYQLPTDGPLPKTYCVTLAITDAANPDWIVSTFLAAQPRIVTAENKGRFTETWDGLDENFMPVSPGTYGVKGIFMAAKTWAIDGEWHSITPKFLGGASSWLPPLSDDTKALPFGGDPVNAPLGDIAVGPNGVSAWAWVYLENGLNYPLLDLKKPIGYDQFIRAFNSGGAGGSSAVATDGETVWAFSVDGGPKYVFRTDEKSFGRSDGANRTNGYLPEGWVTAMTLGEEGGKKLLCVAQRGKIVDQGKKNFAESTTEFVDKITIHDAEKGAVLNSLPLLHPLGLAVQKGILYALHSKDEGFAISSIKLTAGAANKTWQSVFVLPNTIIPADMEMDSHGRFYLSDSGANKVYQLNAAGKILHTFGNFAAQKPGHYDKETFMAPGKLATWTDADGKDRLLVIENAGPNRVTEWSAEGAFIREFMTLQTYANEGYAIDPTHPDEIYVPGQQHWLTRFHVDYTTGQWTVNAVWPNVGSEPRSAGLSKPQLIHANGQTYLAGGRSFNVYRLDGDQWLLSAAILSEQPNGKERITSFWHDTNGNGRVEDEEMQPTKLPGHFLTYHGQNWLEDLSLLTINQNGKDVWRMAPSEWDAHGNPVFEEFMPILTDPIFTARAAGNVDAVHGGNELAEAFVSDWMQADGSLADGFYVQARGGKNFSANEGPQHKISRYVPDGKGGYVLKWRVGRTAMQRLAERGEIYGAMRVRRPINGLLTVIDQSRCGMLLYTEDGLYVDTLFADERRLHREKAGNYLQPGEFFAGVVYPNQDNGKIYLGLGKFTPLIFEVNGWSLKENPAQRLTTLPMSISIAASQMAAPSEIALTVRGGAGKARFMHFTPALGDVDLAGSVRGWESAEPVTFQADEKQKVEVRCLYRPDMLFLRWHARLNGKFTAKPMPALERIFTHDQLADTLSFYLQGNSMAMPGGPQEGRAGDVRFVFGIFDDKGKIQPVALGLYPQWQGPGKGSPQVYRTAQTAAFAHAGPIPGAKLGHAIDEDGQGFVITVTIPRSAIPMMDKPFASGQQTLADFSATFGGHNKFWWANNDGSASRETFDEPTEARLYPGAWAPARFQGLEQGVVAQHWMICGPFGGPGAEKFKEDLNGVMPGTNLNFKDAGHAFAEAAMYPPDQGKVDVNAIFSGDLIKGYWKENREIKWKSSSVAELDQRVILGESAQTWYGATWVHVPADTELECRFVSHPMTWLHWYVNGQAVEGLDFKSLKKEDNRPVATKW